MGSLYPTVNVSPTSSFEQMLLGVIDPCIVLQKPHVTTRWLLVPTMDPVD